MRILDGADVVAEHARSYDRGAQIEIATHIFLSRQPPA
ncbi:hypothetical protein [Caballeronia arvi]